MAKDLAWLEAICTRYVAEDAELYKLYEAMNRMAHVLYEPPASLAAVPWLRIFRSTMPYDALNAGRRTLGSLREGLSLLPTSRTDAERKKANAWERTLQWQFDLAAMRKPTIRADIYGSALQYGEIVGQFIHIPTQEAALKALGAKDPWEAHRREAIYRGGDFAVSIKNPSNVHVRYSEYMAEHFVYIGMKKAQEIVDFWGDRAQFIKDEIDGDPARAEDLYLLVDSQDYDKRMVAAKKTETADSFAGMTMIFEEDNKYPFLGGWIAVRGGTELEDKPDHARQPLLYAVYRSEQWVTTNLVGTLMASQTIAEFGKPGVVVSGPNPRSVKARYGHPGGRWDAPPLHTVIPVPRDAGDPALQQIYQQFVNEMQTSTLPRILVTAEAQPNEAFAGQNQRIMTAMGSLIPFKKMGEYFLAECYRHELLWAHESGFKIQGYDQSFRSKGRPYEIDASDIDPKRIYLTVTCRPNLPIDQQQLVMTAVQGQSLPIPEETWIQMMGFDDAEEQIDDWERGQIRKAILGAKIQRLSAEASGQLAQDAQAMAQKMVEQLMKQQQQGAPQGAGPAGPPDQASQEPPPGAPAGVGAGGQGANPAAGGQAAANGNPAGATNEGATGQTRGGAPIARGA